MQEQLYNRLKNCLQTILELEPELERLQLPSTFRGEMETLRRHLDRIQHIEFQEEDLKRLETATAKFLEELRLPFARMDAAPAKSRVLQ